jgi:hypothetical protein
MSRSLAIDGEKEMVLPKERHPDQTVQEPDSSLFVGDQNTGCPDYLKSASSAATVAEWRSWLETGPFAEAHYSTV